jgi:transposase
MEVEKATKTLSKGVFTMAIIPQQTFLVWDEIEKLGDLERLKLVLEYMPDEELMQELEKERGKGRDDYPIRAMWNSILAGVVYQHPSVESLRRELSRNGQLRFMCGFYKGKVPEAYTYTRFLNKLKEKEEMVNVIFDELVNMLEEILPGFGTNIAIDGKGISSLSKRENKIEKQDGRRDKDGDWAKKEYKGIREDGTPWSKTIKWFGYRLHLIVDSDYELPVAFTLTKASVSEIKQAHKMIEEMMTLIEENKSLNDLLGRLRDSEENERIRESIINADGDFWSEEFKKKAIIASRYLNSVGKGENALELSVALKENLFKKGTGDFKQFKVPTYIKEAIEWVCENT